MICVPARARPRPARSRAGTTSVEFALCAGLLVLMLTGTISLGLLSWTQAALQIVAVQTARCLALGSSLCPSGAQYAVTLAQQKLFTGVISSSNVSITSAASCNGATGQYTAVSITSLYWATTMPTAPMTPTPLTVQACYPSHS